MKENKYSNFTNHKLSSTTQLLWVKAHASHVSLLASDSLADLVARLCPNTALSRVAFLSRRFGFSLIYTVQVMNRRYTILRRIGFSQQITQME